MFKRILKSIVNDINMLYSFELPVEASKELMTSIDHKLDCIKPYDEELWRVAVLYSDSYRQVKKDINSYLKGMN